MKRKSQHKKRKERYPGTLFPNIGMAAAEMGVHRVTLYRALTGRSKQHQLSVRYKEIIGRAA